MKEIKLTQSKFALIDDEDFQRLVQYKWYAILNGHNWYAVRKYSENGKRGNIRMHREILNTQKETFVDHIDGNGLNNCKENLRLCTVQENAFNRKHATKANSLGIKGVDLCKDKKKFRATITVNCKTIHLGYYNVLGDADSAYRKAEKKHFGEFVRKC